MNSDKERLDDSTRRPDGLSDLIKKGISTGVKSVLLTEEGVRNIIADLMPKEISTTVRTHLDGLKKDLYTTLVNEFSSFLEHVDVAGEMKKLLSGMTVEIKTEITFVEKGRTRTRTKKK
jgi:hypothetical protein